MAPTVGSPVQYFPPASDAEARANGNDGPVAAVVTRVWSEGVVNLTVFPDCGSPVARTSIRRGNHVRGDGVAPSSYWEFPPEPTAA